VPWRPLFCPLGAANSAPAMRLVIILIAAAWGVASIFAFLKTKDRSGDAKLTAGYIILWPALVVGLVLSAPVPMWLSVPVMFGFIPWLMAGPHLWAILKDPTAQRPDEVMGIPKAYWKWGGLGAILLGIIFS
jgi:hypothetical protein